MLADILRGRRRGEPPVPDQVLDRDDLRRMFEAVDQVFLPEAVIDYIARLVAASHPDRATCPDDVRPLIRYGASPRAAIAMGEASRAVALLEERPNVDFDDVDRVAVPAMAHRLVMQHNQQSQRLPG